MKRLSVLFVAVLFVLAPLSASAIEIMSDASMETITGQAGVSIAIDDVILETWVGDTTYTDTDGTDGSAGSIVISDQHTFQDIQAITDVVAGAFHSPGLGLTNTTYRPNTDINADGAADIFVAHALSIDVGTCAVLTAGAAYNTALGIGYPYATVGGVVLGLPTLEINTSEDTITVSYTGVGDNTGQDYIQISNGAKTLHVLGGVLEIAPH